MDLVNIQHYIIDKSLFKLKKIIIERDRCGVKLTEVLKDLILFYDSHFYTEKLYLERLKESGDIKKERFLEHVKDHDDFLQEFKKLLILDENNAVNAYLKLEKWNNEHINVFDENDLSI